MASRFIRVLVRVCVSIVVAGLRVFSVSGDGPVHRVVHGRTFTLDTTGETTAEVSLTMDIIRLACVALYDEVASCEGAVLDSLISDM